MLQQQQTIYVTIPAVHDPPADHFGHLKHQLQLHGSQTRVHLSVPIRSASKEHITLLKTILGVSKVVHTISFDFTKLSPNDQPIVKLLFPSFFFHIQPVQHLFLQLDDSSESALFSFFFIAKKLSSKYKYQTLHITLNRVLSAKIFNMIEDFTGFVDQIDKIEIDAKGYGMRCTLPIIENIVRSGVRALSLHHATILDTQVALNITANIQRHYRLSELSVLQCGIIRNVCPGKAMFDGILKSDIERFTFLAYQDFEITVCPQCFVDMTLSIINNPNIKYVKTSWIANVPHAYEAVRIAFITSRRLDLHLEYHPSTIAFTQGMNWYQQQMKFRLNLLADSVHNLFGFKRLPVDIRRLIIKALPNIDYQANWPIPVLQTPL